MQIVFTNAVMYEKLWLKKANFLYNASLNSFLFTGIDSVGSETD